MSSIIHLQHNLNSQSRRLGDLARFWPKFLSFFMYKAKMAHFMLPQSAEIVSPELPSGGVTLPYQYSSTESCQSLQSISNPSNKSASSSSKTTKFSKPSLSPKVSQLKSKWITNWWATECFCWLISVLSLAAIVIILESYKNKPLPQWDFGLTLNSGKWFRIQLVKKTWTVLMAPCRSVSPNGWLFFGEKNFIQSNVVLF